jgi:hypothetical protein
VQIDLLGEFHFAAKAPKHGLAAALELFPERQDLLQFVAGIRARVRVDVLEEHDDFGGPGLLPTLEREPKFFLGVGRVLRVRRGLAPAVMESQNEEVAPGHLAVDHGLSATSGHGEDIFPTQRREFYPRAIGEPLIEFVDHILECLALGCEVSRGCDEDGNLSRRLHGHDRVLRFSGNALLSVSMRIMDGNNLFSSGSGSIKVGSIIGTSLDCNLYLRMVSVQTPVRGGCVPQAAGPVHNDLLGFRDGLLTSQARSAPSRFSAR